MVIAAFALLALLWVLPVFAYLLIRTTVVLPSRALRFLRRARTAASALTLLGLTLRYGTDNDAAHIGQVLASITARGVLTGGACAVVLALLGLLLVAIAPAGQRQRAWRLFWLGPRTPRSSQPYWVPRPRRGVGPGLCMVGLVVSFLVASEAYDTAKDILKSAHAWTAGWEIVLLTPAVILAACVLNAAVAGQAQANAAHPLLPSLAASTFVVAAFISDALSRSDDARLTRTPDTVADELTVIGIVATIVLSALEFRILHLILGVGFTTGPPHLYPRGTRHTWSSLPGHHVRDTALTRLVLRIDHPQSRRPQPGPTPH